VVLKRDKVCQECGHTDLLQAHHIISRSDGGSDNPENGIALCAWHHADKHPELPRGLFFAIACGPRDAQGWTAARVAELIGCHRSSVVRHARKLGIERSGHYWSFTEDDLEALTEEIWPRAYTVKDPTYRNTYLPIGLDAWLKMEATKQHCSVSGFIVSILLAYRDNPYYLAKEFDWAKKEHCGD